MKGGNDNKYIIHLDQYRRRIWAYLCELEGVRQHCSRQENMEEAETQQKGRELGSVSLLSAAKMDESPVLCVCVLCTFST